MTEFLAAPLEIKSIGGADAGTFEGYGAVFHNVDVVGDRLLPGCFAETLAERKATGRPIPMHFNHGLTDVGGERAIGVWLAVEEDGAGLKMQGKLSGMNTDRGRFYYERIKDGAISGMSIGFKTKQATYGRSPGEPRRTIAKLALNEVSIVDDPANPNARIGGVKSQTVAFLAEIEDIKSRLAAGELIELREFERLMRDAFGFSRAQAATIAERGFKSIARESDDEGDPLPPAVKGALDELSKTLRGFSLPMRG